MLNVVGLFFINIAALMAGMVIFAYWNRCDPIKMGRIDTSDQYFPYFILTELGKFPGITGLHVSSVYAGSLSTVSSGINAMSMCTIEDFIKPRVKWSDKKLTNFSMVLVLIYGVAAIGVAYLASKFGPILQASLSILGTYFFSKIVL